MSGYNVMIAKEKYLDGNGKEKTVWVKLGVLKRKQDGKMYMLIDPTVNLAGFDKGVDKGGNPNKGLIAGVFPIEEQQQEAPQQVKQSSVDADEIPF